jgi:hypothetical protein
MNKIRNIPVSLLAAFMQLGLVVALFCASLNTPEWWIIILSAGILISFGVSAWFFRAERKRNPKATSAGIWMATVVFLLLVILNLLPAL